MRISYVLGYLAARYGGPPYSAISVAKHMKDSGCDISFWATGDDADRAEIEQLDINANLFDAGFPRRWFHSRDLYKTLKSRASSFDLFHMHGTWNYPVYAGATVAAKSNTPYIVSPHGGLQTWALRSKNAKKKIYSRLVVNRMFGGAACLHAVTSTEAKCFRAAGYQGPITVITNGVDIPDKDMLPSDAETEELWPRLKNRRVVLFMSRLSPEKGLDLLIPVWQEVAGKSDYKDALLVIAGPDHRGYKKTVDEMIEHCSVGEKVLLTGMVGGREKLALLNRADVFVLPTYSENFGIVVGEAMACETPAITTTGTPWECINNVNAGRCVAPVRGELSRALREILSLSAHERRAMGRRGRQMVIEKYSWREIARKYLMLYNCAMQGKETPFGAG